VQGQKGQRDLLVLFGDNPARFTLSSHLFTPRIPVTLSRGLVARQSPTTSLLFAVVPELSTVHPDFHPRAPGAEWRAPEHKGPRSAARRVLISGGAA